MKGHSYLPILACLGLLGPVAHLKASDVVGQFYTDNGAMVFGRGPAVTLSRGQDYVLFSGDRVQSGSGPGPSVLKIPESGHLTLAPDTAVSVKRSQSEILLDVERGQVGFDLIPGSPIFLKAGEERTHLTQGTGKGGVSVDADGGYLVLAEPQGGFRVTVLDTGEVIYEGDASPELIYAQIAAPPGGASPGRASGGGGAILAPYATTVPFVVGVVTLVLALIDTDPSVFRRDRRTEPPTSPVRP